MGIFRIFTKIENGVYKQTKEVVPLGINFDGIITVRRPEGLLKNIPPDKILEYGVISIYRKYPLDDFIKYEYGFSQLGITLKNDKDGKLYTSVLLMGNNKNNKYVSYLYRNKSYNVTVDSIEEIFILTHYRKLI